MRGIGVRQIVIKFAPEGYPFIAAFVGLTLIALFFGGLWAASSFSILTLFMAYFFRDPDRTIPEERDVYVSPADGRVIQVHVVNEEKHMKSDAVEISIFMSPFNVHVNRAPCDGVVETVVHTPGKFLSAFKPEASLLNENIVMVLQGAVNRVLVRQVAGFIARRAVCRVKPGDDLKKGDRYGMIKFSSRVDIFLPPDTEIAVRVGDRVKAGESILGRVKKG